MTPRSSLTENEYDYKLNFNNKSQMPISTPSPRPIPLPAPPAAPGFENNVYNNPLYTQGFLKQNIGRFIKADFLIGTNSFMDRTGILREVGISYIVIEDPYTNSLVMCDLYSLKFATFFN